MSSIHDSGMVSSLFLVLSHRFYSHCRVCGGVTQPMFPQLRPALMQHFFPGPTLKLLAPANAFFILIEDIIFASSLLFPMVPRVCRVRCRSNGFRFFMQICLIRDPVSTGFVKLSALGFFFKLTDPSF
jgi:hypothetical protein